MPKFIEVCAGCGGLSLGFINSGWEPLLLVEIDKVCCETLRINHPNINVICGDMTEINYDKYKDVDLLMGGVPCQSFSVAGKRKGLDDSRGDLILKFSDLVSKIHPKTFLIENVKGILSHNKGKTFTTIINELNKTKNYDIYYKVLNANDFSVPQNRHRLFIIGVSKMMNKEFAFPMSHAYKPILRDALVNCPDTGEGGVEYSANKKQIMELIPEGGCWIDLPPDIQKSYLGKSYNSGGGKRGIAKRLSFEKPCLTLTTSPNQKQTERCHPKETRPLTIREYARIQSFPDTYKFSGTKTQIYKQIGNAVPVLLSQSIANSLAELFTI